MSNDQDDLSKKLDQIEAVANLCEEFCALNHKHDPRGPQQQAVDYIVVPMSDGSKLQIPICVECAASLADENDGWTLIYCINCTESQWVHSSRSRLSYANKRTGKQTKLLWLIGCPHCTGKMQALYFG